MPRTRADGRKVLASYKSWADFAHSLDHVELHPPVDNYGEVPTPPAKRVVPRVSRAATPGQQASGTTRGS